MFHTSYKPRLQHTRTEGNILMTQIRAQQKLYEPRGERELTPSRREIVGKKQFQHTDHIHFGETCHTRPNTHHGKRVVYARPVGRAEVHGKKQFVNKNAESNQLIEIYSSYESKSRSKSKSPFGGKKRFDQSPTNQRQESSNSPFCFHSRC